MLSETQELDPLDWGHPKLGCCPGGHRCETYLTAAILGSAHQARRQLASCLRRGGLTVIVALSSGCSSGRDSATITVHDSAGIAIVQSPVLGDKSTFGGLLELDLAQPFPDLELTFVRGMLLLSDGRVVIANGGSSQVVFLDPQTRRSVAVGRRGDGPGEFSGFRGLHRCRADSVAVFSPPGRLTVLDNQGRLGRVGRVVTFQPYEYLGLTSDCTSSSFMRTDPQPDHTLGGPFAIKVLWVHAGDSMPVQVATVLGPETTPSRGMPGPVRRPYGSEAAWLVLGDKLVLGRTDTAELRVFDRDGAIERIIRWGAAQTPVTGADHARYTENLHAMEVEAGDETFAILRLDRITLPEFKPVFARLLADDQGNLWVQSYPNQPVIFDNHGFSIFGPDGRFWWIFSPAGRLIGTGTTPAELMIHDIRDGVVAGTMRDADGVEVATLIPLRAAVRQALTGSEPPAH